MIGHVFRLHNNLTLLQMKLVRAGGSRSLTSVPYVPSLQLLNTLIGVGFLLHTPVLESIWSWHLSRRSSGGEFLLHAPCCSPSRR